MSQNRPAERGRPGATVLSDHDAIAQTLRARCCERAAKPPSGEGSGAGKAATPLPAGAGPMRYRIAMRKLRCLGAQMLRFGCVCVCVWCVCVLVAFAFCAFWLRLRFAFWLRFEGFAFWCGKRWRLERAVALVLGIRVLVAFAFGAFAFGAFAFCVLVAF